MLNTWLFLRRFPRPRHFDANVIVIGAGAGGLVSAYIANMLRAKVVLVEKGVMGGDCLNYGCVPSKALLTAAKQTLKRDNCGVHYDAPKIHFAEVMAYVQSKIAVIAPNDSVERYSEMGVKVIQGEAQLLSPYEVKIGEQRITGRSIILATGGSPRIPDWPGLRALNPLTSETVWQLQEQPKHLLVLGGGPIGVELSYAFARLGVYTGSKVTLVERSARILQREEPEAAELAQKVLLQSGVEILLGAEPDHFERNAEGQIVMSLGQRRICGDQILVALGREPASNTCGLAELGIQLTDHGRIEVNQYLQTSIPNIFAVGDVAVPLQFTHVASFSAYFATVNALFGRFKKSAMSLHAVPMVTYLQPEIARIGLTAAAARDEYADDVEVCHYSLKENDRAIAESEVEGFVQLVLQKTKGKVLGVTIVAPHAGEMLGEWTMVLNRKVKKEAIFASIYSYPTYSEANKAVISQYKKQHMPTKILPCLQAFFRWQR